MADIFGKIHSIDTFGTVDGPGIRFVLFLQGCPMRCLYCHNPDTWSSAGGTPMSADEVLREYEKNCEFYSKGGITVTGGEPLVQIDFLLDLFKKAHARGIHTCIDTSGITYSDSDSEYMRKLDELMNYTDLVMLDIKHIDSERHKLLTGHTNERILAFAKFLEKKSVPLWVRHVVLNGYTNGEDDLYALGRFIGGLKNLKALDVLPYHTLGKSKYDSLGLEYPLGDMPSLSRDEASAAKQIILRGIKDERDALTHKK